MQRGEERGKAVAAAAATRDAGWCASSRRASGAVEARGLRTRTAYPQRPSAFAHVDLDEHRFRHENTPRVNANLHDGLLHQLRPRANRLFVQLVQPVDDAVHIKVLYEGAEEATLENQKRCPYYLDDVLPPLL